jgi:hypothetical protein
MAVTKDLQIVVTRDLQVSVTRILHMTMTRVMMADVFDWFLQLAL